MTGLNELINMLRKFSGYSGGSPQSSGAERIIESNIDLIRNSVYAAASLAVRRSTELAAYPPLRDHLLEIIREKLNSTDNFFDITGIFYDKHANIFDVKEPNLISLGDYSDWLSMKQAGKNLFNTKRSSVSQEQKGSGWRYFYQAWKKNKSTDYDIYPAIINARLSWGKSARKAPYWYFIDKAVSRRGYPTQQLVGLSTSIMRSSSSMVLNLNRQLQTPSEDNYIEVDMEAVSRYIDNYVDSVVENTPIPEFPEDVLILSGTILINNVRVKATQALINELIAKKQIARSREYAVGNRWHYYYVKTGKFIGTYAKKLIE